MNEVIYIEQDKKEEEKPVEFTHHQAEDEGWNIATNTPNDFNKVVYLGKCCIDGDMFAAYAYNAIEIFKGHLNSGKY